MANFTRNEYDVACSAIGLRDLLVDVWKRHSRHWHVEGPREHRYKAIRLRLARMEDLDTQREQYDKLHATLINSDLELNHIVLSRPYLDDYILYHLLDTPADSLDNAGDFIASEFRPLLRLLRADDLPPIPPEPERVVQSSEWTGNRSVRELSVAVQRMVPVIQQALEMIVQNEELRLHNGPPEPLAAEALENLRTFHRELGELLDAADAGVSLVNKLKTIAISADRIFQIKRGYDVTLRGLTAVGLSLVPTYCAVWALESIFRMALQGPEKAALSAAAMGGTYYFLGPASDRNKRD